MNNQIKSIKKSKEKKEKKNLKNILNLIKIYFRPKIYTKKQRLVYGLGWFLISIIVAFILRFIGLNFLSYFAIGFGILSLMAIKEPN